MHCFRPALVVALLAASTSATTSTTSTTSPVQTSTFLPPPTWISNLQKAAVPTTEAQTSASTVADFSILPITPSETASSTDIPSSSSALPSSTSSGGSAVGLSGAWTTYIGLLLLQTW
ncbi:hypothetical protein OPT61_g5490 [Boeremia exigua]|uniref:Uncharacterized protein n=1 Tax=Boeremia exigua TaxID=749465 RepID=A0ACC2IA83_9PLEO|nr:hypothetical protein OPT61_g5490 [Boeremia exigua]